MNSDAATAGSDRIKCLLIIRAINDEAVSKELHKDIAGNMRSPKILMEAITAIDRSAQTLDYQLTGGERARRSNNGQKARCHTFQAAGHGKEKCTVPKTNCSVNIAKRRGSTIPIHIAKDNSIRQRRTKLRRKMKDQAPKTDKR